MPREWKAKDLLNKLEDKNIQDRNHMVDDGRETRKQEVIRWRRKQDWR